MKLAKRNEKWHNDLMPPALADTLLELFYNVYEAEEIQGDLYELFQRRVEEYGLKKARHLYWLDVLWFVRPFTRKRKIDLYYKLTPSSSVRSIDMLYNYLIISLRSLRRNRTASTISIFGLSVGLASGLLIFLLVSYLFSFDRYHAKADRTYWVVTDIRHGNVMPTDAAPRPMAEVLRQNYPFVESAVRLETIFGRIISLPDGKGGFSKKFEESRNICFTEPEYFKVFDVEWVSGNPKKALSAPNTIVLSERYVQKYFGTENPMGRILRFDKQTDLTVTGIIKNPPSNTQLRFDAFVSYATLPVLMGDNKQAMQSWDAIASMCFVVLREGVPVDKLRSIFPAMRQKYYNAEEVKTYDFHVLSLSDLNHERSGSAPRPILYALIIVGLFLVVAACINFVNVATAQALKRSREIGIRKVVGSTRWQLIGQFMLETTLVTLASVVVALLLTQLCLPMLNESLSVMNADLSVLDLLHPKPLLWFTGLILLVIILAGFYPALVQSGFNPIAALRGRLTSQQVGGVSVRRGLIVVQFFITQLFIIGVIVAMTQLRYMQGQSLGFDKEAILTIPVPESDPIRQETLRSRLKQVAGIEQVTLGDDPPAAYARMQTPFTYDTHTESEKFGTRIRITDKNYLAVFGIKLVAGRNFRTNDSVANEVLVNEMMVKQLGLASPDKILGKRLQVWDTDKIIVGVVADFHLSDFREPIQPLTLINDLSRCHMAALKITPTNLPATLKAVESTWNEMFPEQVFKSAFIDETVAGFYLRERILLGLAQGFALVAIIISCLGLYGLVTFMAESKTKEIGVRKVLGASIGQLVWLFGREFGKLILIGFVLAAPVGWWLMNGWLQDYSYHVPIGIWVFVLSIGIAIGITVLTVSRVLLKAALRSPARSLRTE